MFFIYSPHYHIITAHSTQVYHTCIRSLLYCHQMFTISFKDVHHFVLTFLLYLCHIVTRCSSSSYLQYYSPVFRHIFTIHSSCVHRHFTISSTYLHSAIIFALKFDHIFTKESPYVCRIFSISSSCCHHTLTRSSLYLYHIIATTSSSYLRRILTICLPYVHQIFILFYHYIYLHDRFSILSPYRHHTCIRYTSYSRHISSSYVNRFVAISSPGVHHMFHQIFIIHSPIVHHILTIFGGESQVRFPSPCTSSLLLVALVCAQCEECFEAQKGSCSCSQIDAFWYVHKMGNAIQHPPLG